MKAYQVAPSCFEFEGHVQTGEAPPRPSSEERVISVTDPSGPSVNWGPNAYPVPHYLSAPSGITSIHTLPTLGSTLSYSRTPQFLPRASLLLLNSTIDFTSAWSPEIPQWQSTKRSAVTLARIQRTGPAGLPPHAA